MKKVKVVVTGSRTFDDYSYLKDAMDIAFQEIKTMGGCEDVSFEIITGTEKGIETLANAYAVNHELALTKFELGCLTGYQSTLEMRNSCMLEYACSNRGELKAWLLVFTKGRSMSNHVNLMVSKARKIGMSVCLFRYNEGINVCIAESC